MGLHTGLRLRKNAGFTLFEVLVAACLMPVVAYGISMIYFSVLNIHSQNAWRLAPYDEATASVQRIADELREAMLIESYGDQYIVAVIPQRDANGDYVIAAGDGGYSLTAGNRIAFYLSDDSGALDAQGNILWMGVAPQGQTSFTRLVKVAENIQPALNPVDPDSGQPRAMFTYRPDAERLWGVELWVTSTAYVEGETRTQTAHSEVYLRNL